MELDSHFKQFEVRSTVGGQSDEPGYDKHEMVTSSLPEAVNLIKTAIVEAKTLPLSLGSFPAQSIGLAAFFREPPTISEDDEKIRISYLGQELVKPIEESCHSWDGATLICSTADVNTLEGCLFFDNINVSEVDENFDVLGFFSSRIQIALDELTKPCQPKPSSS